MTIGTGARAVVVLGGGCRRKAGVRKMGELLQYKENRREKERLKIYYCGMLISPCRVYERQVKG